MTKLQKLREDPRAYIYRVLHEIRLSVSCKVSTIMVLIDAMLRGVTVEGGFHCWGRISLSREAGASIRIGANCTIRTALKSNNIGLYNRTVLSANTRGAELVIGNHVGMSAVTIAAFESIHIGDNCLIGGNVLITDSDWHAIQPEDRLANALGRTFPISIGQNVFIGTRAVILKGSNIGDNSVIGAGSVVSGTIPPNVIAAGNPCRVIRTLNK
jgi:acetyltransferase-like isoleucine patch superfamily enzyme